MEESGGKSMLVTPTMTYLKQKMEGFYYLASLGWLSWTPKGVSTGIKVLESCLGQAISNYRIYNL